jgi:uncharacterized membrane protein
MLTLSVVLPLVAIQVLLAHGASPVIALTSGSCFPVIEIAIEAIRTNRVGVVPLVSLAGIVCGLGAAFITGNAVFAVLKDSVFTLAFGVVFLGSLATPRPLIFRLNRDMAADDQGRAATDALWQYPAARTTFRVLTVVWGIGLIAEAATRAIVAFTLPIAKAAALSPVIAAVAIAVLVAFTIIYSRAARRRAAARRESTGTDAISP